MRISILLAAPILAISLVACATVDATGTGEDDVSTRSDVDEDRSRPDPTADTSSDPVVDPSVDPQSDASSDPQSDPSVDPTVDSGQDPTTDPGVDTPPEVGFDCVADSACTTSDNTCVIYTSGSSLGTECRAAVGAGGPGAECADDADCASGHCLYGTLCLTPCAANTDCPAEELTCQPFDFVLDDAGTGSDLTDDTVISADICLPDFGSMDPCVTIADCLVEEETCALVFDSQFGAERRCLYTVGAGQDTSCTAHEDCQTAFCLGGGFCYWPCAGDTDCSASGDCTLITFIGDGGDDPSAPGCIPTCVSSADCQADEVCQAFYDDDPPNSLVQLCDVAEGTLLLDSGATCSADIDCRSGDCFQYDGGADPRCAGPCDPVTEAGCAAGTVCYENSIYVSFDNGTAFDYTDDVWASISTCLADFGSYQTCARDADCPGGETCAVSFFNASMTALEQRCITPLGAGLAGATCSVDSDCRSGWCYLDPEAGNQCIGACQVATTATDCQSGTTCTDVVFTIERNDETDTDDIDIDVYICL